MVITTHPNISAGNCFECCESKAILHAKNVSSRILGLECIYEGAARRNENELGPGQLEISVTGQPSHTSMKRTRKFSITSYINIGSEYRFSTIRTKFPMI